MGHRRGLRNPWAGEEDGFLVHPQNGLNGLILNWCIDGCWFTPVDELVSLRKVFKLFRLARIVLVFKVCI